MDDGHWAPRRSCAASRAGARWTSSMFGSPTRSCAATFKPVTLTSEPPRAAARKRRASTGYRTSNARGAATPDAPRFERPTVPPPPRPRTGQRASQPIRPGWPVLLHINKNASLGSCWFGQPSAGGSSPPRCCLPSGCFGLRDSRSTSLRWRSGTRRSGASRWSGQTPSSAITPHLDRALFSLRQTPADRPDRAL